MRRDIFDVENVRAFAEKSPAPRSEMLTLMTFADIKAVNPEALSPWKPRTFGSSTWHSKLHGPLGGRSSLPAAIDPTLLNRLRSMVCPRSTTHSAHSSKVFRSATSRRDSPNRFAIISRWPRSSTRTRRNSICVRAVTCST